MIEKVVQEFVWTTRDGSGYEVENSVYNDDRMLDDGNSLLVLKADPFYLRIIDITIQFRSTGELCIKKNPVVTHIIKNLAEKVDGELNIEMNWDDWDELGIKYLKKRTNDHKGSEFLNYFTWKVGQDPRS